MDEHDPLDEYDVEAIADGLELLSAFLEIQDPLIRKNVVDLAKALRPERPGPLAWRDEARAPKPSPPFM